MYEIAIQAAIGGKIIARESVKLAERRPGKCYGETSQESESSSKNEGRKKRMKQIGRSKSPRKRFFPC